MKITEDNLVTSDWDYDRSSDSWRSPYDDCWYCLETALRLEAQENSYRSAQEAYAEEKKTFEKREAEALESIANSLQIITERIKYDR